MEGLIHLQATSSSFRDIFKSQPVTHSFTASFKSFVDALSAAHWQEIRQGLLSVLDKLKHFGLTLAMDGALSGSDKREVCVYRV